MLGVDLPARGQKEAGRTLSWNAVDFLNPPAVYPGAAGQGLSQPPHPHPLFFFPRELLLESPNEPTSSQSAGQLEIRPLSPQALFCFVFFF